MVRTKWFELNAIYTFYPKITRYNLRSDQNIRQVDKTEIVGIPKMYVLRMCLQDKGICVCRMMGQTGYQMGYTSDKQIHTHQLVFTAYPGPLIYDIRPRCFVTVDFPQTRDKRCHMYPYKCRKQHQTAYIYLFMPLGHVTSDSISTLIDVTVGVFIPRLSSSSDFVKVLIIIF